MPDSFSKSAQIVCEFGFESSHQLMRPEWTAEQNAAVFGKCVRLHGHSYRLVVTLRGLIDPQTGMVINFTEVKARVREQVIQPLDHHHLNDILDEMPTAENIAWWIGERLINAFEGVELTRVELWETRTSGAVLEKDDLARLIR